MKKIIGQVSSQIRPNRETSIINAPSSYMKRNSSNTASLKMNPLITITLPR